MSVKVDTMTRWFRLVIPPGYDHTEPWPLLLVFHGGNLSMGFMFNNRKYMIKRCEEENWILVFPNGANFDDNKGAATWNAVHCCNPAFRFDVDDIGFVRKMVDTLSVTLKIETSRIYAMGGSNGGMFTQRLAAEMPDMFAAAAPNQSTIGGQNGRVWIVDFKSCNSNMPVRAINIENKGHGWPGLEESGFDGTNAMIDFLKQFSK